MAGMAEDGKTHIPFQFDLALVREPALERYGRISPGRHGAKVRFPLSLVRTAWIPVEAG